MTALQFAKEFVNDFLDDLKSDPNYYKTNNFWFNKRTLSDDPNLKILNQELNKIGYKIELIDNNEHWAVSKI